MVRKIKSTVKSDEQIFLEQLLKNEKAVECWHYDRANHRAVYRHKPTFTYFSLIVEESAITLSSTHTADTYPEVVRVMNAQFGEPVVAEKMYSWKKKKTIEDHVVTPVAAPEVVESPVISVSKPTSVPQAAPYFKLPRKIVTKKQQIIATMPLETTLASYLQYAFGDQVDFQFGGFDSQKLCVVYRHKTTRMPHHFGVSPSGTRVYFKDAAGGLLREPLPNFTADIAHRLSATNYAFLAAERAMVWYVDSLAEKFPELKK